MQIITAKCAAPIVVVSNSFFCDNQFIKRPIHNSSKNFWRPNKGAKTFFKQSKRFRFQYVMIMFSSSFWTHELTHVTEQRKGYLIIMRSTSYIINDQIFENKPFLGLIWMQMSVDKFWKDFHFIISCFFMFPKKVWLQ